MAQNKEGNEKKPGVKIQDLSPKKDAKGGMARNNQSSVGLNKGGFAEQNRGGNPEQNAGGGANQNALGGGAAN